MSNEQSGREDCHVSHSMQLTLNSNWTTPLVANAMTAGSRVCHVGFAVPAQSHVC